MRIDIYKHEERYLNWKDKMQKSDIEGISKENSNIIKKYIFDMENGLNVAVKSSKGSRSHVRLNNLRQRLCFIAKTLEEKYNIPSIAFLTEEQLFKYFNDMRKGILKRVDGKEYLSVLDYVNVFKAFWHWHMKVNKKSGNEILDITADLDTSRAKPKWVYLSEAEIRKLCDNAKYEYRVLIMFLYDSGIRSPTELLNIKVSDLHDNCKELFISDEISKTFGRRIKLMLCPELLREYIKQKELKADDYLFKEFNYYVANRYLQRLAEKIFGDNETLAGKKYSDITMYDFRHCSCCYWLPRYKSESALKYRFGWKKSDKIHYYSEMLGMKDTISQEDLLVDTTKTELEQRMTQTEKENTILKEKVSYMEKKMEEIQELTNILFKQIEKEKLSKTTYTNVL